VCDDLNKVLLGTQSARMNKQHIAAVCNFRVAAVCSYLVLALITTSSDLVQTHSQSLTTDQMCPSAVTTMLLLLLMNLPELRKPLSLYVCKIYRQLCRARPQGDLIFREGEF